MIKESVLKALSDQVNAEYFSAYLYLGMSAHADRAGFKGVANWLFIQAKEEMAHGTHIYQYILERGAAPAFTDIKAPQLSFGSIKDVFDRVLAHEQGVSDRINKIASLARDEGDHAAYNFIMWYVNEQVEEEASVEEIIAKVNLTENNSGLLYSIDAELGGRTFTDPFAGNAS
ncbi:MAG: ferritin [Treponema sp.]|jgi:ferritin|nr:ferritin [Treponema sp.]